MIQDHLLEILNCKEQELLEKAGWKRSEHPNLIGNSRWSENGKHWVSQDHAVGLARLCKLFEPLTSEMKDLLEAEKQLLLSVGWKLVKEHPSAHGMAEWQHPTQEVTCSQMAAVEQIRSELWDAMWDEALKNPEIKKKLSFTDLLP